MFLNQEIRSQAPLPKAISFLQLCFIILINWFIFILPTLMQALPMATLFVGRKNGSEDECNIQTLCHGADEPLKIQFNIENLSPGMPKWVKATFLEIL